VRGHWGAVAAAFISFGEGNAEKSDKAWRVLVGVAIGAGACGVWSPATGCLPPPWPRRPRWGPQVLQTLPQHCRRQRHPDLALLVLRMRRDRLVFFSPILYMRRDPNPPTMHKFLAPPIPSDSRGRRRCSTETESCIGRTRSSWDIRAVLPHQTLPLLACKLQGKFLIRSNPI
jgi:hypothetical protein